MSVNYYKNFTNETSTKFSLLEMDLINNHQSINVIFTVVLFVVFVAAFILNLLSILSILSAKAYTPINLLILNLAIADLTYSLGIPMFAAQITYKNWPFGIIGCRMFLFTDFVGLIVSILTVCSLSVERFFEVADTKKRIENFTSKFKIFATMVFVVMAWSTAFAFSTFMIVSIDLVKNDHIHICVSKWSDLTLKLFFSFKFLFVFVIPYIIILISSVKLLLFLNKWRTSNLSNNTFYSKYNLNCDTRSNILYLHDGHSTRTSRLYSAINLQESHSTTDGASVSNIKQSSIYLSPKHHGTKSTILSSTSTLKSNSNMIKKSNNNFLTITPNIHFQKKKMSESASMPNIAKNSTGKKILKIQQNEISYDDNSKFESSNYNLNLSRHEPSSIIMNDLNTNSDINNQEKRKKSIAENINSCYSCIHYSFGLDDCFKSGESDSSPIHHSSKKAVVRKKASRLVLTIVLLFLIQFSPLWIFQLLIVFTQDFINNIHFINLIISTLSYSNTIANPIIYMLATYNFREYCQKGFLKFITRCCHRINY